MPRPHDPPQNTRVARILRARATPEERKLWSVLRLYKHEGFHFRRQVAMGPFIADFACHGAKLIIEADGAQHDAAADASRDRWFLRAGYRTLRFPNNAIHREFDGVIRAIRWELGLE